MFAINLQLVFCSDGGERARVIDLQTKADNDWKEEILVVLASELALAFIFAMDSAEKWKTLSLSKGASNLLINSSWCLKGREIGGPELFGNKRRGWCEMGASCSWLSA